MSGIDERFPRDTLVAYPVPDQSIHVVPNNGLHENGATCWCEPKVDDGEPKRARIWIHNDIPKPSDLEE